MKLTILSHSYILLLNYITTLAEDIPVPGHVREHSCPLCAQGRKQGSLVTPECCAQDSGSTNLEKVQLAKSGRFPQDCWPLRNHSRLPKNSIMSRVAQTIKSEAPCQ